MTLEPDTSYIIAVVFFFIATALIVVQCVTIARLRRRARAAEQRFETLQHITPALTAAASAAGEATRATCGRIIERTASLVPAQSLLCLYVEGSRLMLGAREGSGYVGFLREGAAYEGDTIADWVRREGNPAIVGPRPSGLPQHLGVYDFGKDPATGRIGSGPIAGSRDTTWAIAVPLVRPPSATERASVIGVLYADRPRVYPFVEDDVTTLLTIAQLAGDALARALFADRVRREATHDQLTGLLSPTGFRKRLREEVDARRADTRVGAMRDIALFFIDTDHFKIWNDTYGHASGDQLLRRLAAMFSQMASLAHGFAGRNGGDEFCIALLDRTKDASIELARDLCTRVADADFRSLAGRDDLPGVHITVSIGVAHFPKDISPDERQATERLLEAADQRMYEAKHAGRNQVAFSRARVRA
ncbi:MAG: sensor domain-containing diguanylate cyclase [Candidatus Eremiobacteraeota bacterium]|nr:sensor domain-containing diguanylate cyclase [Candidatus Eremiobacteraeota bacterium]MBV8221741.1 sensor domain-containing diguanylate cyclase [Candidatus Eremiobacteraeota bacterium]MBV8280648.1 sensor domain-containing diguanylate cyclase [Candidatus Eremiobacteraeota bacterium]